MVDRYTFQDDEVGMEIAEDGYWMAYEDYEALEAKLTRLVEEVKLLHNTETCKSYRFTTKCKLCEAISAAKGDTHAKTNTKI